MRSEPLLHVLTSDAVVARPGFERTAAGILESAGARVALHLRTRTLSGRAYCAVVRRLADVSRASGALLVVNARVDIALACGADGVQLGRGAISLADARRIAPALQIGVSIHMPGEALGAAPDWFIAGPIYPTATHPGTPPLGLPFLEEVVRITPAPVVAVGGIGVAQVREILGAGARGVAVLSGIWDEDDPDGATMRYLSAYADRADR